ncbi:MAG TPA: glycosyltransferase family 2 protein [Bryobacteraceae bacterium]|jgi:glycosyltransferase involved in cell wall biosynthesis|nr:glycosyltransferase family 2 protein [Bryobacteraceae bacterium]
MKTSNNAVRVSVVIPTRSRPDLVRRAIESVLEQTLTNFEVVVIVDGPDPITVATLQKLNDPRVRCIELERNVGGAEARNVGIRESRGEWIAFLDDDDEWLPTKLEAQLRVTESLADPRVVIASQYFEQTENDRFIQPRAVPRSGQAISEYLFCETNFKGIRQGFLQTSTWFVSRELLLSVPFTTGLKRNQDTDWLLRAFADPRVQLILIEQPLAVFYNQSSAVRISNTLDWQYHYEWLLSREKLFTKRAAAYFIASICMATAVQQGTDARVFRKLLLAAFRRAPFSLKCLWFCVANRFIFPHRGVLRLQAAKLFAR